MRKLIATLRITPTPALIQVIDEAWRIDHIRGSDPGERIVAPSSFLFAATELNDEIRRTLARHGLRYEEWKTLINMDRMSPSFVPPPPDDYAVTPGVDQALTMYAQNQPRRPLDPVGLTWALLAVATGRARKAVEDAGLSVANAVIALSTMVRGTAEALVPLQALTEFKISLEVFTLVDSARILGDEYDAPVTTSSMILAILRLDMSETQPVGERFETQPYADIADAIRGTATLAEVQKRIEEWMLWYRHGREMTTKAVVRVFQRALALAQSESEATIHPRHIVKALFTIPPTEESGVEDVLRWLGTDSSRLRKFIDERANVVVVKTSAAKHTLASIDTEQTSGEDLLDFARDVKSFATLITAKNLEYRDQLQPEKATRRGSVAGYGATAFDYLEKIFQVPFWIEPLSDDATRDLLTGIVQVRHDHTEAPAPAPTPLPVGTRNPNASASRAATPPAEAEMEAEVEDRVPPPPSEPWPGEDRLNPAALLLEPFELRSMHVLAPLIGRSPRAVKRFANIYRIIRGKKPDEQLAAFIGREDARGEYERVLLLLAIITGAPSISTEVLEQFRNAAPSQTLTEFAERASHRVDAEWVRAIRAIREYAAEHEHASVADLQPHLREVSRYSFREPIL